MRFDSAEDVIEWADRVAAKDVERSQQGLDLNPYCTQGARNEWQMGFDGKPPPSYILPNLWEFNTIYQRGKAVARILKGQK